jgi:phosphate-selective porin OprO/OprP
MAGPCFIAGGTWEGGHEGPTRVLTMILRRLAVALALSAALIGSAPTPVTAQDAFPDSLWNYVQTPWLNFVFGLGVMMDVTGYNQDQASKDRFGDLNVGREGEIRGMRGIFLGQVRLLGRSYDYVFAAAYRGFDRGFEQEDENSVALLDIAISVPLWADLHAVIGKQKEPFSHDRVQSMLYNPSHERPAYIDALSRSRNDGILIERWNREASWKWAVGYYNDWLSPGGESFSDNPRSIIGRVTGLPIDREADNGPLLHVGGSLNYTSAPIGADLYVRAKPEAFFAPNFIDTGVFLAESVLNKGLEAALIAGPWNVVTEVIHTSTNAPAVGDPSFLGWHAQVGWTITGERRSYDRRWGVVSLLAPDAPTGVGGMGAWQLGARVSHIDAIDELVDGGTMTKYSLNLQWYLSRFTFAALHVGYADLKRDGINSGTWISLIRWGILTS